jgi:hypothetical protein
LSALTPPSALGSYVPKPFRTEELLDALERLLSTRARSMLG